MPRNFFSLFTAGIVLTGVLTAHADSLPVLLTQEEGGVRVDVEGKFFTRYNFTQADKP